MIGLDTNVLVRYITQDGPEAARANALLERKTAKVASYFIPTICLCEMVWVLNRAYGYRREQIARILASVLKTESFVVESAEMVSQAITDYAKGPADFSDYLLGHISRAHGATHVVTFDRKAGRTANFKPL